MKHINTLRKSFILLILFNPLGCSESPQIPPPNPPSMDAVIEAFESPTGTLNATTGPALAEAVVDTLEDLQELESIAGLLDELLNSVEGTQTKSSKLRISQDAQDEALGVRTDSLSVAGGVWGRLTYTCGPDDDISADRYGQVVLNILHDSSVAWGQALDCFVPNTDQPSYVNGPIALYLPALGSGDVVSDLDLQYTLGTDERRFSSGFRYGQDSLSMIRDVNGQTFVLTVSTNQTQSIGVKDRCGEWTCDIADARCRFASATGDCDTLSQEVTW